ncbi:phosphoenolpyruvate carboxykinase (GTP) [Hyperthermus butylicus]
MAVLEARMSRDMLEKLLRIRDPELHRWIADVIRVTEPAMVYLITSEEDFEYVRKAALRNREELPTRYPRHTVHFDGPRDIARDRKNTRILLPGGEKIPFINTYDRDKGLAEIRELLRGIMRGREMFIGFYCFGPKRSPFTLHAVQITDSAYVAHNENILYRLCYDEFVEKAPNLFYARFIHSAGERGENGWSKNIDKRRIYVDLHDYTVYSVNTQYGGNTIGLKKLMFRLCIYKGYLEGWLCEHMFIVGVRGPGGRLTYFTGAFPAGCGKTSTAFISDTIVGDDLAIIKPVNGVPHGVNPEMGMFGIIDGVNPRDDPVLYKLLTDPSNEIIFSNVLLTDDGEVWWNGKEGEPRPGLNYAGRWWPGKKDENGREVPPSHPNARFTISLRSLPNLDPRVDDPMGVPISAMIFGGRDPDTWVPVEEAFDWVHGIITKAAALESEKTAAILEKAGVRELNPFAILDFLPISIGKFIQLHLDFAEKVEKLPRIFSVNYFLRDEQGRYIAEKVDKRVWLKWMELRVHGDVDAVRTPTGLIPVYQDLVKLFEEHLGKDYPESRYEKEFMLRVPQHLAKIERVWKVYEQIPDTPKVLFDVLRKQKERLKEAQSRWGDYISPFKFDRR